MTDTLTSAFPEPDTPRSTSGHPNSEFNSLQIQLLEKEELCKRTFLHAQFLKYEGVPGDLATESHTCLRLINSMFRTALEEANACRTNTSETSVALADRDAEINALLIHSQNERSELKRQISQNEAHQFKISELQAALSAIEQKAKITQKDLENAEAQLSCAKDRIAILESQSGSSRDEAIAVLREKDTQSKIITDLRSRILLLEEENFLKTTAAADVQQRCIALELRNAALSHELEQLDSKKGISSRDTVDSHVPVKRSIPEQLSPRPHSLSLANADYGVLKTRFDALLADKNAEIESLQKSKKSIESELDHVRATLASQLDESKKTNDTCSTQAGEIRRYLAEISSLKAQFDVMEQQQASLRDEMGTNVRKLKQAERHSQELEDSKQALQDKLNQANEHKDAMVERVATQQGEIGRLTEQLRERRTIVGQLETTVTELRRELDQSKQSLRDAKHGLQAAKDSVLPLQQELQRYDRLVRQLREKFQLSTSRSEKISAEEPARLPGQETISDYKSPKSVSSRATIVEQLQDIIFVKDLELKKCYAHIKELQLALQQSDQTVEELTSCQILKHNEFQASLKSAVESFANFGTYEKLVDEVFNAKSVIVTAETFRAERDSLREYASHMEVRCRVMERHLEDTIREKEGSVSLARLKENISNYRSSSFAEQLKKAMDEVTQEHAERSKSEVLTLDEDGCATDMSVAVHATKGDAVGMDTSTRASWAKIVSKVRDARGVNESIEAPNSDVSNAKKIFRDGADANDLHRPLGLLLRLGDLQEKTKNKTSFEAKHLKAGKIAELREKISRVDVMREQLLTLESAAASTESGTTRRIMFERINDLHDKLSPSTSRVHTPSTSPSAVRGHSGANQTQDLPRLREVQSKLSSTQELQNRRWRS